MKLALLIIAPALLLGALVTELASRFWAGSPLALMVLAGTAIIISNLLVWRFARTLSNAATAAGSRGANVSGGQNNRREHNREQNNREQNRREGSAPSRPKRERPAREPAAPTRATTQSTPPPADAATEEGTVKWFNRTKGFGFIIRPNGEEIFVHQRSIITTDDSGRRRRPGLDDGQKVRFKVVNREKGDQAEEVVPL